MVCLHTWTALLIVICWAGPVISVVKPPLIIRQSDQTLQFKEGESIEIRCECAADPIPRFSWQKNGRRLDVGRDDNLMWEGMNKGTIIINHPRPRDAGVFQCFCENTHGTAATQPVTLVAAKLDRFPSVSRATPHTARIGSPQILTCNPPTSLPEAHIFWQIADETDFRVVRPNDRIHLDDTGNLYFSNVLASDEIAGSAKYICVARNSYLRTLVQGEDQSLKVIGTGPEPSAPMLMWATQPPYIGLFNHEYSLKCIFSGYPTPTVHWRRVDKPMSTRVNAEGNVLTFHRIKYSDAGVYECEGRNDRTVNPQKKRFQLRIESLPDWVLTPKNQDVPEEETVSYVCRAKGSPMPKVQMYINGKRVEEDRPSERRLISPGNITFVNLIKRDSLVVQCKASNRHGFIFHNAFLNVLAEPPVWRLPPQKELKAALGSTVNFTCQTNAAPIAKVTWTKGLGDRGILLSGPRYKMFRNGNLQISNVTVDDAGVYECTAKNKFGRLVRNGKIVTRQPTVITLRPVDVSIRAGGEATFQCNAQTDKREKDNLKIDWLKDGTLLEPSLNPNVFKNTLDFSLTITDAKMTDSGKYTCLATNGIDQSTADAQLKVRDVPNPPRAVSVDCASRLLEKIAIITWESGGDNYSPITEYSVQYNTNFQPDQWNKVVAEDWPADVPKRVEFRLSPWVEYKFRVIATNRLGPSNPSRTAPELCKTDPAPPDQAPHNVRIESSRPDNIIIRWDPMPRIQQNGPDFKYVIAWRIEDPSYREQRRFSSVHKISDPDQRELVIDGQPTYKRYSVTVTCENSKGASSAPVEREYGYSGEDKPTVAPTGLSVDLSTITDKQARFTWNAVANDPEQIKGFFVGYRIQYWNQKDGYESRRETDVKIHARPRHRRQTVREIMEYTVQDIPSYSDVVAQVKVINTQYEGPPSRQVTFRTKEGYPSQPQLLEVHMYGSSYLEIQWAEPLHKNGVLKGYQVGVAHIKDGVSGRIRWLDVITNTLQTRYRIEDLRATETYEISVRALSRVGNGEVNTIRATTIHDGPPVPPSFEINNIGERSFNVSWTPSKDGNPGSVFFVQYRIVGRSDWKMSNSENAVQRWKLIRDLLPGTGYQVRMLVRDANNKNPRPSAFESVTTTGVAAVANIATTSWFVGLMCGAGFLLLILIIVCIVKRSKGGGKYPVQEKEKLRSEMMDNGGFGDPYKSTLERSGAPAAFMAGPGTGSIGSTDKPNGSESGDSLAEYAETENSKFNEEGSFIGQYGGIKKSSVTPDIQTPTALSTFV